MASGNGTSGKSYGAKNSGFRLHHSFLSAVSQSSPLRIRAYFKRIAGSAACSRRTRVLRPCIASRTQIPMIGEGIHDQKELLGLAYSTMSGPLVTLSLSIVSPIVHHWSQNRLVRAGSTIGVFAFWLAAYPVLSSFVGDELYPMTVILILAMVILSWGRSYALGMSVGLKAANPEQTYPLVSLEVIQGTSFDQAWLYERTDSHYRLVTRSGSNHIIPAANVKAIRGL